MFGRSYETLGNPFSDLVLQTRGKIKIRWGNKYIDLIKDGKIVTDSNILRSVATVDDISVDGIYYVEENGSIYLVIEGNRINLFGEVGTTYVSFVGEQDTTNTQKEQAQKNIGLVFPTLVAAQASGLTNGFVYITSENEFYKVINSTYEKFSFSGSNLFNKQVIIELDNTEDGSALYIKGYYSSRNNQLVIGEGDNSLFLYSTSDGGYINANLDKIEFQLDTIPILVLTRNSVKSELPVEAPKFVSNTFESSTPNGFSLKYENGQSTLTVDNIVVRKEPLNTESLVLPEYWMRKVNIIKEMIVEDLSYTITLMQKNEFEAGEIVTVLIPVQGDYTSDEGTSLLQEFATFVKVSFTIDSTDDEDGSSTIIATLIEESVDETLLDTLGLDIEDVVLLGVGQKVFLTGGANIELIKFHNQNIDLMTTNSYEDEADITKVTNRIGNIKDLNLIIPSNGESIDINSNITLNSGIYSNNLVTNNTLGVNSKLIAPRFNGGPNNNLYPEYDANLTIPAGDDSKKIATTEWVNDLLFPGMIVMYNGQAAIPNGWSICDGSNGTPNLVGKFIKASTTAGTTGGSNQVTLFEANMPAHTHTVSGGTVNTSSAGEHTHTVDRLIYGVSAEATDKSVVTWDMDSSVITSEDGAHTHEVDLSNITVSTVGSGTAFNTEPEYYSLIFIMKL